MLLSLMVACDENRVIGRNGRLPWNLPLDLQRFKEVSMGKTIVMGMKTHLSIGRALPGRKNIVVTSRPKIVEAGCQIYRDLKSALKSVQDEEEVLAIGGEKIYRECLPTARRIYLTEVASAILDGDVFFPELDFREWQVKTLARHLPDSQHAYGFSFKVLDRV